MSKHQKKARAIVCHGPLCWYGLGHAGGHTPGCNSQAEQLTTALEDAEREERERLEREVEACVRAGMLRGYATRLLVAIREAGGDH